jgi:DNA-binding CsgD family transcriptional regulator
MAHVAVAIYLLVELIIFAIAVISSLLYRRSREKGYLYASMMFGSIAVMLLCEIAIAYCEANGLQMALWLFWLIEAAHGIAQLVHVFSIIRLAVSIVRLRRSKLFDAIHLTFVAVYAALIVLFLVRHSFFQLELIAFGAAHAVSLGILIAYRRRMLSPTLRGLVVRFAAVGLVFAPTIGISVYTGLADRLPLGRTALQVAYLLVGEFVVGYYAARMLFARSSVDEPVQHPERYESILSERELEIVSMVKNGYTNREIAELLGISPRTVTNHLYNIYKKIDVRNRVELINEVAAEE